MTLIKWNNGSKSTPSLNTRSFFDAFNYPFESVKLLHNLLDDDLGITGSNIGRTLPAINIADTADAITIDVAAPGMKKNNFGIEFNDNKLRISYKHESNKEANEQKNVWRREYHFESFERTFNLPETIDGEKISATYEDGILKISVPKKEEAKKKPARMIDVK